MKITKIIINNFRLLKNTEIDLENDLSLSLVKITVGKHRFFLHFQSFLENRNLQLVLIMMILI